MSSAKPQPGDVVTLPPPLPATIEAGSPGESVPSLRHVGDYEILDEIARGGMGVIFRARQMSVNRVVALKMILSGQLAAPAEIRRFRTEAEAAANLDHPNILPVYEAGEHDGRPFFSMKLASSGTLAGRIADYGADPRATAALLAKLARAVHFAHQRGILHRDLKPANVLLEADGNPLISDFGLAKRTAGDPGITNTGAIVGTPSYMAPEQARADKAITTAADVYALGAILYELLTGRPPFRDESVMVTLFQVMTDPPPDPRTVNANADRDLSAIALKCLEKDPAARYGSAEELADDLDRWLAGDPTHARPLGLAAQAWRWLKRHTTAAITLPMLGLALGIWPALLNEVEVRPELLPASLASPLGWYRIVMTYPAVLIIASLVTLALYAGFGWFVVRVSRPRTTGIALGFAVAVAAISSIVATTFAAPLLIEQGRTTVADGEDRLHPVGDDDPESGWLARSKQQGTDEYKEAEYLKQFLPPEKRSLDYEGADEDIRRLRKHAARANRLRAGYRAFGEEMFYGTTGTILWSVVSTWLVLYLDRTRGRRWTNLIRYFELTIPTLFALAALLVTLLAPPMPDGEKTFILIIGGYLLVLAIVAWVGNICRWHWWIRWPLYALMTLALFGIAVAAAAVRAGE